MTRLARDLKQRGLLDDTLVIFGTEFGRTSFAQGAINYGLLTFRSQGRDFRLTDVGGKVVQGLLA
jgi:uncharacterized protein DUF1501